LGQRNDNLEKTDMENACLYLFKREKKNDPQISQMYTDEEEDTGIAEFPRACYNPRKELLR
jgi:hypothetical protein